MGMVRHIEFTIDFDLTCWGLNEDDFENDDEINISEDVADFIIHNADELIPQLEIKKVWYEKECD